MSHWHLRFFLWSKDRRNLNVPHRFQIQNRFCDHNFFAIRTKEEIGQILVLFLTGELSLKLKVKLTVVKLSLILTFVYCVFILSGKKQTLDLKMTMAKLWFLVLLNIESVSGRGYDRWMCMLNRVEFETKYAHLARCYLNFSYWQYVLLIAMMIIVL